MMNRAMGDFLDVQRREWKTTSVQYVSDRIVWVELDFFIVLQRFWKE